MTWKAGIKRSIRRHQAVNTAYSNRKPQHPDARRKSSKTLPSDNSIPDEHKDAHVAVKALLGNDYPCYANLPPINYPTLQRISPDHESQAVDILSHHPDMTEEELIAYAESITKTGWLQQEAIDLEECPCKGCNCPDCVQCNPPEEVVA